MSVKTAAQLLLDVNTFLPDNTSELISASDERDRLIDIIDSYLNKTDFFTGTSAQYVAGNGTLQTAPVISDTAYNATSWNANLDAPSKNAIRDQIETMLISGWNISGNALSARAKIGSTGGVYGWDYIINDVVIGDVSDEGILNFIKGFKRNSITLDDRKASLTKSSKLAVFGDSISTGYGVASGYGYQDIVTNLLGLILDEQAVSSRGVYKAVENAYALILAKTDINSTWMAGFNDLRRSATTATYNKLKNSLRAFIANNFLDTAVAGNDGDVTLTGSWSNLTAGVIGDKAVNLGGQAVYTSTEGDEAEYTFTGNSLVIGTWAVDGVNEFGGTFTIDIDGTVVDTYTSTGQTDGVSDGTYHNQRTPTCLVYQNLGNGSHTVTITVTDVVASGYVYIDFFGTLRNPSESPSVFVFDIPKMNSTGYATSPDQASDAVFNAGDIAQQEVIDEFRSYPVFRVYTNDFYDIATGLDADNIHPNETGHSQISEAFLNRVSYIKNNGEYLSSLNKGFVGQFEESLLIGVNRNPLTGDFYNTGKAAAMIQLLGENGNSGFTVWTANGNNTSPSAYFNVDEDGDVIMLNNSKAFYYGLKSADGSWRRRLDGDDIIDERRESGVWVEKNRILA